VIAYLMYATVNLIEKILIKKRGKKIWKQLKFYLL
jgi:hypothetical protein